MDESTVKEVKNIDAAIAHVRYVCGTRTAKEVNRSL